MTWKHSTSTVRWEAPYRFSGDRDAPPSPLIVALHGMGEDEKVMSRRLRPLAGAGRRLLVPRAPFPTEIRHGDRIRIGHAWYQYDGDETRFVESMDRAAGHLFPMIDRVVWESGAVAGSTVLVGFSQGAYLGYYLALRYPDRFRGVVGIAGRAKEEVLEPHLDAARDVSVLHLHGETDAVVSADACRDSIETLAAAGLDAHFVLVSGAHDVSPEMVDAIGQFVDRLEIDGPGSGGTSAT